MELGQRLGAEGCGRRGCRAGAWSSLLVLLRRGKVTPSSGWTWSPETWFCGCFLLLTGERLLSNKYEQPLLPEEEGDGRCWVLEGERGSERPGRAFRWKLTAAGIFTVGA